MSKIKIKLEMYSLLTSQNIQITHGQQVVPRMSNLHKTDTFKKKSVPIQKLNILINSRYNTFLFYFLQ